MEEDLSDRRLSALIDAGLSLASELDLDALLQRIADLSRDVIGARYGAVGVLSAEGALSKFLYSGIDAETVRKIGDLPEGRGVLGALIEEGKPLRLREISDHPRSHGFPAHHPEMHTFLGAPILVRGRVFGRLYLTEKRGGEQFTKDDERLALVFAAQAGVAIENAGLYGQVQERSEELARRLAELSSVEVIGKLLLSGSPTEEMFRSVAEEARILTKATRAVLTLLDEPTQDLTIRVAVGDQVAAELIGKGIPAGTSKSHAVLSRQKSELVEDMSSDPEIHFETWRLLGEPATGAFAPLIVKGRGVGTLAVFQRAGGLSFTRDDLSILDMLARMAAIALENDRLNEALRDLAVLEERERISQELHDGVIQSIYSVGLSLQGARSLMERDPEATRARMDMAIGELDNVVRDVRGYIFDLRPKIVEEVGLAEAIRGLVRELEVNTLAHTATDIQPEILDLLDEQQQIHLVQIVREILSNISRHAQASEVWLSCDLQDGVVRLVVEDDGVGFDPAKVRRGFGLNSIEDRAARVEGVLEIQARRPKGTVHRLRIPIPSDRGV